MVDNQGKIPFITEDGEVIEFYVLEQTTINGMNYILVADSCDEEVEANALIFQEIREENSDEIIYRVVEDEEQLEAIAQVFEEMMDCIDIQTDQ